MIYDTYIDENSFTSDEYYTAKEQFVFFKRNDKRFKWDFHKPTEKWFYRNEVINEVKKHGTRILNEYILQGQVIRVYQPLEENALWTILYRQRDTGDVKNKNNSELKYKITKEEYNKICGCMKSTEVRLNDRQFEIGNIVLLEEYDNEQYSGRKAKFFLKNVIYLNDVLKYYNAYDVALHGIAILELDLIEC